MSDELCDTKEQLQQQLYELEILQSIYANPGEIELYDPNVICEIQDYIDDKSNTLPSRLDYIITLNLKDKNVTVALFCCMPHDYPALAAPDLHIRCEQMTRSQQRALNDDLHTFLDGDTAEPGAGGMTCVLSALQWIQENDNIRHYDTDDTATTMSEPTAAAGSRGEDKFVRLWIYSHHIYSKYKRKDIIDLAGELGLSGFSLPGKPGIICVEGAAANTDDFWSQIRAMTWKKIVVRHREEEAVGAGCDLSASRRFDGFQEQAFEAWQGAGRNYHMDMGKFHAYLTKHASAYMFPIYFGGIEGKSASAAATNNITT